MRTGRLIILVSSLWIAGVAAAALTPTTSVSSSPPKAGARPIVLTLALHYEMQCGYPGQGPVVIDFPQKMRMPRTLAANSVLVDGKPATKVGMNHHQVSVGLTRRTGVICDVLGLGTLTIVFDQAADLGNPSRAGTYLVTARNGSLHFAAHLVIKRV